MCRLAGSPVDGVSRQGCTSWYVCQYDEERVRWMLSWTREKRERSSISVEHSHSSCLVGCMLVQRRSVHLRSERELHAAFQRAAVEWKRWEQLHQVGELGSYTCTCRQVESGIYGCCVRVPALPPAPWLPVHPAGWTLASNDANSEPWCEASRV